MPPGIGAIGSTFGGGGDALLVLLLLVLFLLGLFGVLFFIRWVLRLLDAVLVKANRRLRSSLYSRFWESP